MPYTIDLAPFFRVVIVTKRPKIRNYHVFKKSHEAVYLLGLPCLRYVTDILLRAATDRSSYRSIIIDDGIKSTDQLTFRKHASPAKPKQERDYQNAAIK